jgi:AmpD protein
MPDDGEIAGNEIRCGFHVAVDCRMLARVQPKNMRLPPLEVDLATGLLQGTRYLESPNCDARPAGCEAELLIVHGISLPPASFGGPWIDRLFTNDLPVDAHPYFATLDGLRVSSHALIRRDGEITQYVRFTDRAWHAGKSRFAGRDGCNDFSVGIELEGADRVPYEDVQYRVLATLIAALCAAYPRLSPERLVGHSDVAPGRKTDPGPAFDWPRARRLVALACSRRQRPV